MEYTHIQKYITTSPRKLRLVADIVRSLPAEKAVSTLHFINKTAAIPLAKAITVAMANAGKKEELYFKNLEVNEGPKLKRFRAGTRGRAKPYKRRWSHIKIVLTDEVVSDKRQVTSKKLKNQESEIIEQKGMEQIKSKSI